VFVLLSLCSFSFSFDIFCSLELQRKKRKNLLIFLFWILLASLVPYILFSTMSSKTASPKPKTADKAAASPAAKPAAAAAKPAAAKPVAKVGKRSNPLIARGVRKYGAKKTEHAKRVWAVKKDLRKQHPKKVVAKKTVPFGKSTREVKPKLARNLLPLNRKHAAKKFRPKVTIRKSITPGTVLILLAGPHRGKRVVFLKALPSGLLLVTGPYVINGVPLRRVNQAYVIATSTKVNIGKVNVDAKFTDCYFRRGRCSRNQGAENFDPKKPKDATDKTKEKADKNKNAPASKKLKEERVADQKTVDSQLLPLIDAVPLLRGYLTAKFALSNGQYPHAMKF